MSASGYPKGRPSASLPRRRPPIDPRKEAAILDDLREGKAGIIKLATAHGVGVGTVQRIKASLNV